MSDNEEVLSTTTANIIRYTKEVMISLYDSPLVQKPEDMPSLLTWFGEDPESPACKNILNGSIITRAPSDKSIILGPTKTNFASSLHGGLKRTDEGSNTSKPSQPNPSRHNHRQPDERSNNTGLKEYRSPRGPSYIGEKGFLHRNENNKTTSDRKFMGSSPPHNNNKRYNDRTSDVKNGMNGNNGRRDYTLNNNNNNNRANGRNNHHNNNNNHQDADAERVPEWMDYTPEAEAEAKEEDMQAQFANDLEAWKSNMKKRDGINENPVVVKPEKKIEESLETLSMEPQQSDPLSFFEEAPVEPRREQKGGSRFAKFFAKREEPMTTAVVEAPVQPQESASSQPRSISLNDLFQGPQLATAGTPTAGQYKQTPPPMQHQHQQLSPQHLQQLHLQQQQPNLRVYSEEDILKSLGAKKATAEAKGNQNEDAMGFNRVLQILSQPKPSLPHSSSSGSGNGDELQGSPKTNRGSPLMTGSPFENKPSSSTSSLSSASNRFNSNLPTSVLRQMSARSSEGKSPSLQSTKPAQPGSNLRYSPGAVKQHLPPHIQAQHQSQQLPQQQQQQQQMPNGIPLPAQYFAYQQPPYSPQPPMMDHRAFEQLVQFNNGDMPPPRGMPPPYLRNGNNSDLPHMMVPHLLPPGQRHITPPPHFNQQQMLHMQGQGQPRFPLQQQQQPMPPHVMANGIPPQMFGKNQGWERQ
ncbi:hypothetical protein [Parasitella parasitica]|uniref:Uncharacterized protein n=1 Tax=Parasitella parasitica TaxID=35722 RepID=A0A0B7MVP5_9FUNG|nr:hypothetical protein [Parasitella parasitica]